MYIKKVYIMWKKDYVYMYDILCICTSASYEVMRRCSINLQRYAPPGQESCVGQKKIGRSNIEPQTI